MLRENQPRGRHRRFVVYAVLLVLIIAAIVVGPDMLYRPAKFETVVRRAAPLRPAATSAVQPAALPSQSAVSPSVAPNPAASTGVLSITTLPAGAEVELDGIRMGVTALTLSAVKPGRHTLRVSKTGFRSVTRDIEVTAGDTITLDLSLAALPPPARRRAPSTPPLPPPPPPPLPPPPRP